MSKERRERQDKRRLERLQKEFARQEALYKATTVKPLTRSIRDGLKQGRG